MSVWVCLSTNVCVFSVCCAEKMDGRAGGWSLIGRRLKGKPAHLSTRQGSGMVIPMTEVWFLHLQVLALMIINVWRNTGCEYYLKIFIYFFTTNFESSGWCRVYFLVLCFNYFFLVVCEMKCEYVFNWSQVSRPLLMLGIMPYQPKSRNSVIKIEPWLFNIPLGLNRT